MKPKIVVGQSSITAGQLKDLFEKAQRGVVNFQNLEGYLENPNRFLEPRESVSQKIARLIMGSNFRSLQDVESAFNRKFTPSEQKILNHIPYSEEVLMECRDTHLLIPYFETNLIDLKTNAADATHSDNDWFMNGNPFAKNEKTPVGWVLIMKECVKDSFSKTYEEQIALLATHGNPQAIDFIFMLALEANLQRDQVLLKYWNDKAWGRTKSLGSNGDRVYAGLSESRVVVLRSDGVAGGRLGRVGVWKSE